MRAVRRPGHRRDGARASHYGELVLVATDDAAVRRVLCDMLDEHGYRAVIADPSTAIDELAAQLRPIVILLDVDSTGGGLALLARLRSHGTVPVIVLSARSSESDKVAALDAGADDYVVKPFAAKELLARLRVALRHARARRSVEQAIEVGPIRIDTARYRVTVADRPVHLTPIEFRLLALLARSRGSVVTREELRRGLWGAGPDQADHLRVHVAALRKKLEPDPGSPRWLITVVGVGYRLGD